ncbi:MAG: TolC family protein [Gemmatimonadota bacterium]
MSAHPARAGLAPALACVALALALAAHAGPAGAQGVRESHSLGGGSPRRLALAEALDIGLEENPTVRASRFRRSASTAGIWEAYGNFLPQLQLSSALQQSGGGQVFVEGVPIPGGGPDIYTTYYEFQLSHRLFDAGRDFLRLGGARAERRAADAQVDEERLRVAAEIRRRYIEALAATARREQAEREIEGRRGRLDLARARFQLGEVTRSDELQASIQVSEAEVDRVTSERDVRGAKLELLRAMGVEVDADSVELTDRFTVFEPVIDPDSLVRLAFREHPALRRLRATREVRGSEHSIAKTAYLPTLQAGVALQSTSSDTTEFLFRDFENRHFYTVGLQWDLFTGFSRYNDASRAKAELRVAEESVRDAELEIEAGVRQAYLALVNARRTHLTQVDNVELARQQLELAQERYRIGALSFPDLQDAQVTFSAVETDFIRSTYDFFLALASLEEASAQPLFPRGSPAASSSP